MPASLPVSTPIIKSILKLGRLTGASGSVHHAHFVAGADFGVFSRVDLFCAEYVFIMGE